MPSYNLILFQTCIVPKLNREIIKSNIDSNHVVSCFNDALDRITNHFPKAVIEELDQNFYRFMVHNFCFGVRINITFDDTQDEGFILYAEESDQYDL